MTAPPVPYFGGKQRIAGTIASLFPPHRHYVEPYCGGLSVLLAKPPSVAETVNDLDGDLMTFWRVLRDRPEELERACALTPHSRAEHQGAYHLGALDEVESARRVWVQLTQGRNARRDKTGWRNDPNASEGSTLPERLDCYTRRIQPAAARLRRVSLESRPALDVIAQYGRHPDVLLYVDPPYLGSLRASGVYLHEMGDDSDHRALATALATTTAAVVISGYHSPLYDQLYAGWHVREIAASTAHAVKGSQTRTEVLWSNRPLGDQPSLFDTEDVA